jgi:C-terminal processing protease CtpA/Prc
MVRASSRPGFTGQVILLIGPDSVSAAEVFAMSLFFFGLPNEIYLAEDGRSFDAVGVPPDIRVPVFSDQDLKNGRDSALAKAIELLGRGER